MSHNSSAAFPGKTNFTPDLSDFLSQPLDTNDTPIGYYKKKISVDILHFNFQLP